jgi:hypothetical protein
LTSGRNFFKRTSFSCEGSLVCLPQKLAGSLHHRAL